MSRLLSLLRDNLINAGSGDACPFFTWSEFDESDVFFIFPATRYFAVYRQFDSKVEFYRIVNDMRKVPSDCQKVVEMITNDSEGAYLEAYLCLVSPYEIIQKFGKKHKYLLYELDLL